MDTIDPVEALFAPAKTAGVPMYLICERAGVASSTPSRWRNDKNGATTTALKALDDALTAIIAGRPAQAAA